MVAADAWSQSTSVGERKVRNGRPVLSVLLIAALTIWTGCAHLGGPGRGAQTLKARGEAVLEEAGPGGAVPAGEWETVLRAAGEGFAAPTAPTDDLKRLTAIEAARHVALARLLEQVEGSEVTQRSMVRNMTFVLQELQGEVSGRLAGVRVASSDYDAATGKAEVVLMIGLDAEGNVVPAPESGVLPGAPVSEAARRLRAEAAARMDALVKLREQFGRVEVGQEVRVRDLRLARQEAWTTVEGILEGVRFGEAEWPSPERCEVVATLVVEAADLDRLRGVAGAH
jgi:hypothetical protein